jgi:hypothetical protein
VERFPFRRTETLMKTVTISLLVLIFLFTGSAVGRNKKDPAEYPLVAHVLSINSHGGVSGISTSSYNAQTGQWTYGHGTVDSSDSTVQFRIGNLFYTGGYACRKKVQVGTDVHARVEKNKLFILTNDGQTCETHVRSVEELSKETK